MDPDPDPGGPKNTWIRIRIRNNVGNLDPHPDPHLHQSEKLDPEPDPHKFADDKPKCMEYEPILALFQGSKS
jgi:hypothetical protein